MDDATLSALCDLADAEAAARRDEAEAQRQARLELEDEARALAQLRALGLRDPSAFIVRVLQRLAAASPAAAPDDARADGAPSAPALPSLPARAAAPATPLPAAAAGRGAAAQPPPAPAPAAAAAAAAAPPAPTCFIYLLRLAHGKWYVGRADLRPRAVEARLAQHCGADPGCPGAAWTALHPPLGVLHAAPGAREDEDRCVKEAALLLGAEHVRGGSYSRVREPPPLPHAASSRELEARGAGDCCFGCGQRGHFAWQCRARSGAPAAPCARCGRAGHWVERCRHVTGSDGARLAPAQHPAAAAACALFLKRMELERAGVQLPARTDDSYY
jgi:hypothetical protein